MAQVRTPEAGKARGEERGAGRGKPLCTDELAKIDADCVIGDGEAETTPLATSWHSNELLSPATEGVVPPILHLNGYKIANPCVLARISLDERDHLTRGYGDTPWRRVRHRDEERAAAAMNHRRFQG